MYLTHIIHVLGTRTLIQFPTVCYETVRDWMNGNSVELAEWMGGNVVASYFILNT